jgi:hypothetical protein
MRSLSKFISKNEPHSKILQHNITREKILDASMLQSILPRLITTPDAVPQDWDSAYLLLLSKELEHRGFLIPESFKENEIQYSNKVQPLKRPKKGFFNSTISRIEALSDDAKYVFFGVPSDLGSSKSGARAGPDLIRGRSQSLNFRSNTGKGLYSINDRSFFNHSSPLFDVGNIALERAGLDCWLEAIQSTVSQMPHTSVPIMVGGDHTFTFASFKAIRKKRKKPVSFIHFESHLDLQIWGEINQNNPVLQIKMRIEMNKTDWFFSFRFAS